ncbi:MAG: methyltransferase family protein [Promethearchaeota archaeon]
MKELNQTEINNKNWIWSLIRWGYWTIIFLIAVISLFLLYTEFLGQDIFLFYKPFISTINLLSLNLSALLFAYFSIRSVMPVTREEKIGQDAWEECYQDRLKMSYALIVMIINMFLWIWFPITELNIAIFQENVLGILIAILIFVPCSIILYFALKHGGKEHMKPMRETTLHEGIYNIIRHPGIWGEMPLYIAIGFFINSLFITVWVTILVVIYVPVYIYYEEKDLLKRFGQPYREYRERVGALIPKVWRKKEWEK